MFKKLPYLTIKPLNSLLKFSQKLDIFIIFSFGENKLLTSISQNTEKYPNWNDSFTFLLSEIEKNAITIQFWDYNLERINPESFICEGTLSYDSLIENNCLAFDKKKMQWIKLYKNEQEIAELLLETEVNQQEIACCKEDNKKNISFLSNLNSGHNKENLEEPVQQRVVNRNYYVKEEVLPVHSSIFKKSVLVAKKSVLVDNSAGPRIMQKVPSTTVFYPTQNIPSTFIDKNKQKLKKIIVPQQIITNPSYIVQKPLKSSFSYLDKQPPQPLQRVSILQPKMILYHIK